MIAARQRKARNFCAKEIQVTRAACLDGGLGSKSAPATWSTEARGRGRPLASDEC